MTTKLGSVLGQRLRVILAVLVVVGGPGSSLPALAQDGPLLGCLGDCDASGEVDVADLVRAVRASLSQPGDVFCDAIDGDASGEVEPDELLLAADRVLAGCAGDPFEPDDAQEQARTIRCESRVGGSITPGDADWLRFRVDSRSAAVLEILGDRGDSHLGLYDTAGALLGEDDDGGVGYFSRIERVCGANALVAGDYLGRVRAYDAAESIERYEAILHCLPCDRDNWTPTPSPLRETPTATVTRSPTPPPVVDDAFEYDDVLPHAQPIACGEIQHRTIGFGGDVDVLRFDLPQASSLAVDARTVQGTYFYPSLEVLDASGSPIASGTQIRLTCGSEAVLAGRHYVRLAHYGPIEYTIAVACGPCEPDTPTPTRTASATRTPSPPASATPPSITATRTRTRTITPTPSAVIDAYEPDDSIAQAKPLACGGTQSHTFVPANDVDYVRLTLDRHTGLFLHATIHAEIRLFDAAGALVESQYSSLERTCGAGALPPGTYYASARGSFSNDGYRLSALCVPCSGPAWTATPTPTSIRTPAPLPPDAYEPDGTPANAKRIKCGETQSRTFSTIADDDRLTLTLNEVAGLRIRTTPDAYLSVVTPDGAGEATYGDLSLPCEYDPAAPGLYRILLESSGIEPGAYEVEVTCDPCAPEVRTPSATRTRFVLPTPTQTPAGDQLEPDDSRAAARPIACGQKLDQTLSPGSDVDWHSFTLPQTSTIVLDADVRTNNSFPVRFILRNADGGSIEEMQQSQGRGRLARDCGIDALDAGTYFIEVASSFSTRAAYDLHLRCLPCDVANPTPTATITRTATRTPSITPTATPTQGPDSFEPDGDAATASAIACDASQQRSLLPAGDVDWIAIELASASRVVIDTIGPSGGDTVLTLLDGGLSTIAADDDSGPAAYSRLGVDLGPGSYFVRVESGAGVLPLYQLRVDCLPPITPGVGPACGNGTTEVGETCDDGETFGGDGCAANCTLEHALDLHLGDETTTESRATIQTGLFALLLNIHGSIAMKLGDRRADDVVDADGSPLYRAGDIPVTLLVDDNAGRIAPITVPGLICTCLRFVELRTCDGEPPQPASPAFCSGNPAACGNEQACAATLGSGVCGAGVIACNGLAQPDYYYYADSLTGEYVFDRLLGDASSGVRIDLAVAIGTIQDSGTCSDDESDPRKGPDGMPCTDDDPAESRGFASLQVQTTGRALGSVRNVNNQNTRNIEEGSFCGALPCQTMATGNMVSCERIENGDSAGLCLASVFPTLDQPTTGDIVVPVVFCGVP